MTLVSVLCLAKRTLSQLERKKNFGCGLNVRLALISQHEVLEKLRTAELRMCLTSWCLHALLPFTDEIAPTLLPKWAEDWWTKLLDKESEILEISPIYRFKCVSHSCQETFPLQDVNTLPTTEHRWRITFLRCWKSSQRSRLSGSPRSPNQATSSFVVMKQNGSIWKI